MFNIYRICLFILVVITIGMSFACELDQMRHGCRIYNAQCGCGYGCMSEYRYNTIEECKLSLHGGRHDRCYQKPCKNGGSCLQISQEPKFKCQCEGTGFYGARCDKACPGPHNLRVHGHGPFPYECVVI